MMTHGVIRVGMRQLGVCTLGFVAAQVFSTVSARAQGNVASTHAIAEDRAAAQALLARRVTVKLDRVSLRTAIETIEAQIGATVNYRYSVVDAYRTPVTVHADHVPLATVFAQLLAHTNLAVLPVEGGRLEIVAMPRPDNAVSGVITGHVMSAETKRPLANAAVTVDDAQRGVTTDQNGVFRIAGVSAGSHRVRVRLLGYAQQAKEVDVADGQPTAIDIILAISANTLDQVVVTGTVIPTELKAVPSAITVITAKQIEERGITHIDQLFRGDVPGLFASNGGGASSSLGVVMFSRGVTGVSPYSVSSYGTNPLKTYVDGVELADPQYLNQIDPKSIDRIEILTGPQASTIYGSNAMNGVMQVFTKRGSTSHPTLTLNLLSGAVQNNYSNALTPQHDYSASATGIEGHIAYNVGGSWNYIGRWTPAAQLTQSGAFFGGRMTMPTPVGSITADVSLRYADMARRFAGSALQPVTALTISGYYGYGLGNNGLNSIGTLDGQDRTAGLTLGYAPTSWWSHEFELGWDAEDVNQIQRPAITSPSDTLVLLYPTYTSRQSLRYNTTVQFPLLSNVRATVTGGADGWESLTGSFVARSTTLVGNFTGTTTTSRQPGHNTGAFLQTQVSILDHLFLTGGFRDEWNPNFGANAQPNYSPRYGIAYTNDVGALTFKLRGSYGRSTRPPAPKLKLAVTNTNTSTAAVYGTYNSIDANPNLEPEYQQGGEGGLELYFGNRASLIITRYNQTVDNLIDQAAPFTDSVRSLVPNPLFFGNTPCSALTTTPTYCSSQDANGYAYAQILQNVNAGNVRNQGWELQQSVTTGPFTVHGTYSWTKSRVIGANPQYRYFINNTTYTPGTPFRYVPEHTWALGITYAQPNTTVLLSLTGVGQIRVAADQMLLLHMSSGLRLQSNYFDLRSPNQYVPMNGGYMMADLNVSRRLSSHFEAVGQMQNIANKYVNDQVSQSAVIGRQFKVGARIR